MKSDGARLAPLLLASGMALVGFPASADAAGVVQVNFKPYFNADVVLNGSPGAFDLDMDTIEGVWSFVTASAGAGALCGGPHLPDDAHFAGNSQHPEVQLGWSNIDDGDNTLQFASTDSVTIEVPNLAYDSLFLYATGAWETSLIVILNYTSGDPVEVAQLYFPSWFDEAPPGYFDLVDGLDRGRFDKALNLDCEDVNDPGIVGRAVPVDPTRTLTSFTLARTDIDKGVLNVFGANAMLARQVYDYDLTSIFNADLVANTGGCAPGDFDHVHDGLEDGYQMPTQTMASCWESGSFGLPNDGVFPADAAHPRFHLAFSNGDSGLNARRWPPGQGNDVFVIDAVDAAVDKVHLFGAGGVGYTVLGVKFFYSTGSPQLVAGGVILDWWYADGAQLEPAAYYLVDGMDVFKTSGSGGINHYDIGDAALFGLPVAADPTRVLTSIEITSYDPTGFPVPQSTLGLFGAAGVRIPDFYVYVDDFENGSSSGWSAQAP